MDFIPTGQCEARNGFGYALSVCQVEYGHNLLFRNGAPMEPGVQHHRRARRKETTTGFAGRRAPG